MIAAVDTVRRVRRKIVGYGYRLYKYRYRWHMDDLVARGLTLGNNITVQPDAHIDHHFPYLINIGDNCVLSGGVRLLAHVPTGLDGCLILGRVEVRENCYFGQNSLVLPGVTIGPNVLVAAGSVVDKDIPPNCCVAGVPARVYAPFDEMIERHRKQFVERAVFQYNDIRYTTDERVIERVRKAVSDGGAYAQGFVPRPPHLVDGDQYKGRRLK